MAAGELRTPRCWLQPAFTGDRSSGLLGLNISGVDVKIWLQKAGRARGCPQRLPQLGRNLPDPLPWAAPMPCSSFPFAREAEGGGDDDDDDEGALFSLAAQTIP